MKGFIRKRMWAKAVLLLCSGAPLATAGCYEYKDFVDPCYPDRYNHMSQNEVKEALAAQVNKGHMLDQTVWNYDFEPGTDRLNSLGIDHLVVLARRLPQVDTLLYLQTAQLPLGREILPGEPVFDPANPDKLTTTRQELDAKRIVAIQKFMMAITAGRGYDFQVAVIDPSEVGLPAVPVSSAITQMYTTHFKGNLTTTTSTSGGGGASSGGGSSSGSR